MTSWPWMKGISEAIADPIDPVCPEDDRPSVKALIKEHGEKIAKIKAALVDDPLYEESKHDDLWIMRFWMSHKKSQVAIDAAKHSLAFRKEHKLDEQDIREVPTQNVKDGKIREFLDLWEEDAMAFTHPHPKRGVIAFLKFAAMNQHTAVETLTEDYWLPLFVYCTEWTHQWLDYVTRTTGRLTKSVRIANLDGVGMSSMSREYMKRTGKVLGMMEDCYPQLLESLFACNPPTIIDTLWSLISVVLPKRIINKFCIMHPKENLKDRARLYKHISEEDLPDMFGGNNPIGPQDWAAPKVVVHNALTGIEDEVEV
ncbi:expressed unknown protein [Seminavis robusta]|uniref:CRAL-TRIO domain-containing protein n=1 Tax=Seminavis robusta TaxID=568900 RepID=A0A9N8HQK6_9STRA|nr:expressed unknown protein [Seminavis robusta]|eukprot:Sro1175_g249171.1  (313) ;mRNA; f:19388-20577